MESPRDAPSSCICSAAEEEACSLLEFAISRQPNYLLEFYRIGNYVKVSIIDPVSNTEASIVGDPRASEAELTRIAVRKLEYVMKKKQAETKR